MKDSRINISLLLAAIAAAITEGAVAVYHSLKVADDCKAAVLSFVCCLALVGAATVPLFLTIGQALKTASVRRLSQLLKRGFGGEDDGGVAVSLVVVSLALLTAAALSIRLSLILAAEMTLVYALSVEVILFVLLLSLCLTVAPRLSSLLAKLKRRFISKTIGDLPLTVVLLWIIAGLLFFSTAHLVSLRYAFLPAAIVAGVALGLLSRVRRTILYALTKKRALVISVLFALLVGLVLVFLDAMPGATKQVLLYRAPYAGTLLGFARTFFDADGDGFSSVLLGGDCRDDDPGVHPGARDVPENGKDEDCSGEDAVKYVPPKRPSFERPALLPKRPNIVLILLDALRPDHVGFNGYHRAVSPNLDAFRKDAVLFSRAYSPSPVTQSIMLSMFTGYDFRRSPRKYVGYKRYTVPPEVDTIAERLARVEYRNIGYTISYVILSAKGLGQGFRVWKTPWPVKKWSMARKKGSVITTDAAIKHLEKLPSDGRRPFFMLVHYYSTHAPYYQYPGWDFGNSDADRYDSSLAHQDHELGRLLEALDEREDKDNTIVFIFSDHGEMLGDHGLTDHGRSLYESDVRVLLTARLPSSNVKTVESPVSLTDLAPTVLELAQAGKANRDFDGQSLLPYVYHGYEHRKRPIFMFTELKAGTVNYNSSAVLSWPHKYILDRRANAEELYDVQKDAKEGNNLVFKRLKEARRLKRLLESFEASIKPRK